MKCVFITAMVIYTITIQAVPCFYDNISSYHPAISRHGDMVSNGGNRSLDGQPSCMRGHYWWMNMLPLSPSTGHSTTLSRTQPSSTPTTSGPLTLASTNRPLQIPFHWATLEHNKDRPAGDLYPNLQIIKFLEADHDPQVLNPFWSQPAGLICRFSGDPRVSAGRGTPRYGSSQPTGLEVSEKYNVFLFIYCIVTRGY